ncbi:uncharacterized protein CLUP02_05771 [Colletotrichum lupini]|uniref:Uncharacterized protein n=1 Tax=Colletotrichum lupini TaxID=145971 RepID=A0A9Q8WE15_9PEZI|nr:uncharacterized protein CLUP02_05771 [Colletotrichum lupini]UQC80288.1 hypothetical protein CLUP02_05771 [Colletotrichum lupini]
MSGPAKILGEGPFRAWSRQEVTTYRTVGKARASHYESPSIVPAARLCRQLRQI